MNTIKSLKPVLHLLFTAALLICFAGPAITHFQQGHLWLSVCFWASGVFYVGQSVGRFWAALQAK